jgi:hypothetical protein
VARWTLIVRNGPRVERAAFATLGAALTALEVRMDELAPQARREAIEVFKRRYDAVRQVTVRAEVAGPRRLLPSVRGGVDLRGDGSAEAYTGHWRRELLSPEPGETPYQALRQALGDEAPPAPETP